MPGPETVLTADYFAQLPPDYIDGIYGQTLDVSIHIADLDLPKTDPIRISLQKLIKAVHPIAKTHGQFPEWRYVFTTTGNGSADLARVTSATLAEVPILSTVVGLGMRTVIDTRQYDRVPIEIVSYNGRYWMAS